MKIKYNPTDVWGILIVALVFGNIVIGASLINKVNYMIKNINSDNPTTTTATTTVPSTKYDALAKCLTDKGFVMYGSQYCPHCANQENMFGDSFKYINYVECTEEPGTTECNEKNILGVPTWIYPNGELSGTQSLEELSEISGCKL